MPRQLETLGFKELESDLAQMARRLGSEYGGAFRGIAESILQEAAEPIKAAALRHVSVRTGKLRDAIQAGRVSKRVHKDGGYTITVGVHRESGAGYAAPVEFGHGGPGPAPAHPFMRPAYNEANDQAYAIIRARLIDELNKLGT